MKQRIKKVIGEVAEDIFGKLAFIFAFTAEERAPLDFDQCTGSCVAFSGPISGTLGLLITSESLAELTGNMLGIEKEEVAAAHQDDALKELTNVICGNLLPKIAGKDAIFQVAPPEITRDFKIMQSQSAAFTCKASISFDEGECDLYLSIEEGLPDCPSEDPV